VTSERFQVLCTVSTFKVYSFFVAATNLFLDSLQTLDHLLYHPRSRIIGQVF
jgi:hypothetical protein